MTAAPRIDWNAVQRRLDLARSKLTETVDDDPARAGLLLQERTRRLARSRAEAVAQTAVLRLRIGSEHYGLELASIDGVTRCEAPTPLPGVAAEISGMVCRRGEIVPICDLAQLLGTGTDRESGGILVLLRCDGRRVGLLVDAAEGVAQLEMRELEASQRNGTYKLVRGTTAAGMAILDADALRAALTERGL